MKVENVNLLTSQSTKSSFGTNVRFVEFPAVNEITSDTGHWLHGAGPRARGLHSSVQRRLRAAAALLPFAAGAAGARVVAPDFRRGGRRRDVRFCVAHLRQRPEIGL